MASQLPITRIQSSQKIEIATVDLVDGVDKVALIGAALQSRNLLVIASNQSAADGAKLTSLRLEAFSTLGDGTELAIDSNGVLVVASSVDADTGEGVALTQAQSDKINAVIVKERIAGQGQVTTDDSVDPMQLMGDTGKVGNQYLLELERPEIGYEHRRDTGVGRPKFYRVVISVAGAAAKFAVVSIQKHLDVSIPPITKEIVA